MTCYTICAGPTSVILSVCLPSTVVMLNVRSDELVVQPLYGVVIIMLLLYITTPAVGISIT